MYVHGISVNMSRSPFKITIKKCVLMFLLKCQMIIFRKFKIVKSHALQQRRIERKIHRMKRKEKYTIWDNVYISIQFPNKNQQLQFPDNIL